MPEGDTIHRVAARLQPMLEGQTVTRLEVTRLVTELPQLGETIDVVHAVGKHLVIGFSGGRFIRVHLKMTGSWHAYRAGERWRRSPSRARVVIGTAEWTAVCFDAPDVSVTDDPGRELDDLGPDLCVPGVDIAEAVARFDRFLDPKTEIAVALLDQRVAAGIGNVYKCDVLFLEGIHPRRPLGEVEPEVRTDLLNRSAHLLQANLGAGPRRTVPEGLAVYGRDGRPCRRCGATIERFRQGADLPRITFFCPNCQR